MPNMKAIAFIVSEKSPTLSSGHGRPAGWLEGRTDRHSSFYRFKFFHLTQKLRKKNSGLFQRTIADSPFVLYNYASFFLKDFINFLRINFILIFEGVIKE